MIKSAMFSKRREEGGLSCSILSKLSTGSVLWRPGRMSEAYGQVSCVMQKVEGG